MRAGNQCRGAFTLIELLVVVAIIALLISILLPSLAQAREQAKCVTCATNLRSIAQASCTYLTTNGRYSHPWLWPEQLGPEAFNYPYWGPNPLVTLRGDREIAAGEASSVWDCPNAVVRRLGHLQGNGIELYSWKKLPPGANGTPQWIAHEWRYKYMSYGTNDYGIGEMSIRDLGHDTGIAERIVPVRGTTDNTIFWGVRESLVKSPADFIAYTETDRSGEFDMIAVSCLNDWCVAQEEQPGNPHPKQNTRGANVAFFDGHVAWYPTWKRYNMVLAEAVPDGIMIASDRKHYSFNERGRWRMMWTRDFVVQPDSCDDPQTE
jgi:prepilin-type N-terminal cleavage/methylation domain-containing protein/prepilin-type processing-associated H-X9-DG protein